ncbi:hypothetical protein ACRAWD_04035 [Caulobacter segnis]
MKRDRGRGRRWVATARSDLFFTSAIRVATTSPPSIRLQTTHYRRRRR